MALRAVFVDAAGTLLHPREPVGITYARAARARGLHADPVVVQARFRAALGQRRGTEQVGDGRAYWRPVVAEALDHDDEALFEELYAAYAQPRAWWVDTEALRVLGAMSRHGMRIGIISNWDTRLRALYHRFALDRLFPYLLCSAEMGVEKPDPAIFEAACRVAGVAPGEAAHVGDDQEADVAGASRAGMVGLLFDEERGWAWVEGEINRLRRGGPMFGRRPLPSAP